MSGIWTFAAAIVSFGATALLGKYMIPRLKKLHFGQKIREEGPSWHKKKEGTPTMGGLIFIAGFLLAVIVGLAGYYGFAAAEGFGGETFLLRMKVFSGIFTALGFGAVGFIDDYVKVTKKRNLGLTAMQKLVLQFVIAAVYLASVALAGGTTVTLIPFVGAVDLGFWYWILSAILIVGIVNAVNFTDGIDGLCSSVTFFCAIFLMVLAGMRGMFGFSIVSVALAGACMGFLVWNFNPAKVFMGDTGSLFLGGAICALAFGIDMPILLLPLGLIYFAELFSVVLQVLYFKITKGKRLFKMSPIHHHFEMCGWSEVKVCAIFSGTEILGGVIALLCVYFGIHI